MPLAIDADELDAIATAAYHAMVKILKVICTGYNCLQIYSHVG